MKHKTNVGMQVDTGILPEKS